MKTLLFILSTFGLFLFGCWETKPKWEDSSFDYTDIRLDSVEINQFSYGDFSSSVDSDAIYSTYGNPEETYVKMHNQQLRNDYIFFNGNLIIGKYVDGCKIRFINFEEPSLKASLNGLRLDSNTSLKQVKQFFPNSFDWRNLGIADSGLDFREKYEGQKVKFDHIRVTLVDEDRKYLGKIELSFIDSRLEQLRVVRPQDIIQK